MFFKKSRKKIFCAFCRTPYLIYNKKHVGVGEGLLILIMVGYLNYFFTVDFTWLMPVLFLVVLMLVDLGIRTQWRVSLTCSHCGFDPHLYQKNPSAAADRVNRFIERRAKDPFYLLRASPKLPQRKVPLKSRSSSAKKREPEDLRKN